MRKFDQIFEEFMPKLVHELPAYLTYHNAAHTQYVIDKTVMISSHENIAAADLELLKIAALFHDMGYLVQAENHEEIACGMIRNDLQTYQLGDGEKNKICGMIMATKVPQKPKNLLEKILADADLEYLGTDLYDQISNDLHEEILYTNPSLSSQQWIELQIDFLNKHRYHTDFCLQHREHVKQKKIQTLHQILEEQYR